MESGRDGEGRVHAHDSGIEVEFGHSLEAARRTFLNAHPAALAVIDQYFVEAIRAFRTSNAGLRTNQITVIAGVAGATTEAAACLLGGLFFREPLTHLHLRFAPCDWLKHRLVRTPKLWAF